MLRFWPTAVAWAGNPAPACKTPTFPGSQRAVLFGQLRCESAGRALFSGQGSNGLRRVDSPSLTSPSSTSQRSHPYSPVGNSLALL